MTVLVATHDLPLISNAASDYPERWPSRRHCADVVMFSGRESATERWGPFLLPGEPQHRIAAASWQRLLSRPGTTCLIWLVVAISLALPGALLLTLDSVHRMTTDFDRAVQLSVMLETDATLADAEAIQGCYHCLARDRSGHLLAP